jgi:hypothetical protein
MGVFSKNFYLPPTIVGKVARVHLNLESNVPIGGGIE